MALLLENGSEDDLRRKKLTTSFQLAIDDVAYFKNPRALIKLLKSDYDLTPEDRNMLAEFFAGNLKRRRGRPQGKHGFRNDWLQRADLEYEKFKRRYPNLPRDKIIEKLDKAHRPPGDNRDLHEYMRRSFKRR